MTIGSRLLIMVLTLLTVLSFGVAWSGGRAVEDVRILMPAPFVDANASLVSDSTQSIKAAFICRSRGAHSKPNRSVIWRSAAFAGRSAL